MKHVVRLFHQGLGKAERPVDFEKEMGRIPYLNGGLFEVHQLEQANTEIQIPDEAFDRIFKFFDEYRWHLDERYVRASEAEAPKDEINPDVLGYIFEKYINEKQKQNGAYYTKEDITEYISKNTIIPFLLDRAKDLCEVAFRSNGPVWSLLAQDPDRYFYQAVKHGVGLELPASIAAGLDDVSKRDGWNRTAPEEYALPTEIWREVVARRKRYEEIWQKLAAGEVTSINDLITYNLDIRQFAQDVVENAEGSDLLWAFYQAIEQVTVLDPTCGSGAFLFAALNILQRLYEACLTGMQRFVDSDDRAIVQGSKKGQPAFQNFRKVLAQVAKHPNHRYFVLKSIIINNLYGVDIMEEAVEIAKLRLFLKLAAQVEPDSTSPNFGLEPLPDIDFNIQAGNTLVGFATLEEARRSLLGGLQGKMDFDNAGDRIEEKAKEVERGFENFRRLQTDYGIGGAEVAPALAQGKQELREKLNILRNELDSYLAAEYGIDKGHLTTKAKFDTAFQSWRESHQPLHWFVEFYSIIADGGFDVIIGNPPYVEYSKVRNKYTLPANVYQSESCGNLYAFVYERSILLLRNFGRQGLIVPISLVCTQRMEPLQKMILSQSSNHWQSIYAERPAKLFSGAEVLLTISIFEKDQNNTNLTWTTGLRKWAAEERQILFDSTTYNLMPFRIRNFILPKVSSELEVSIINKVWNSKGILGQGFRSKSDYKIFYRIGGGRYWKIFTTFQPKFILKGKQSVSSRESYLYFSNFGERNAAVSILSSTFFYWYFILTTNGRDLNPSDLKELPLAIDNLNKKQVSTLAELSSRLMDDYILNKAEKHKVSSQTGEITYEEFYPRKSKPIIDEIDHVLAKHYGFTDEELDFIINYDIKYRMGRDSGEGEED